MSVSPSQIDTVSNSKKFLRFDSHHYFFHVQDECEAESEDSTHIEVQSIKFPQQKR